MARLALAFCALITTEILVAFPSPSTALAQPQCDARDAVLAVLAEKYQENPVSMGVTHNGGLVEVLATEDGATWSIIVTTPQGVACLVAAGEGWRPAQSAPPQDPRT